MVTINDLVSAKIIDIAETNIPDCWVKRNKIGTAHGEAKLYVGGTNTKNWHEFFDNFEIICFVAKSDLLTYLGLAEIEYKSQTQQYRNDISSYWLENIRKVQALADIIPFSLTHKPYVNSARFYVNSSDDVYGLLREIALPVMTRLLMQKINVNGTNHIWFRPYIVELGNYLWDDITEKQEHDIEQDTNIKVTERQAIIQARIGQGLFRDAIIERYRSCIVTGVDDKRILVASHIKPWSVSSNAERLSPDNGILLTPTFDKLFDKGFISFKNNSELIVSDFISEENLQRLKIVRGTRCPLLQVAGGLKTNLEYHRDMILKKL